MLKIFAVVLPKKKRKGLRRIFYEYNSNSGLEYITVFAGNLKSKKNKRALEKFLYSFKGRVVFKNGCETSELKEFLYNEELFVKRAVAEAFLRYVKKTKPKKVMVCDEGFLRDEYFIILAGYTDELVVTKREIEMGLREKILKESGLADIGEKPWGDGYALLDIVGDDSLKPYAKVIFKKEINSLCPKALKQIVPEDFRCFSTLRILALLFYEGDRYDLLEEYVNIITKYTCN